MKNIATRTLGLAAAVLITAFSPACDRDVKEVQLTDQQFERALQDAEHVDVEEVRTRLVQSEEGRITKHSEATVWIQYEEDGEPLVAGGTISCEATCTGTGCGVKGCDVIGGYKCSGAICESAGDPCGEPSCTKKSSGTVAPPTPVGPGTPAGPTPG